jgi:hypothetical protein
VFLVKENSIEEDIKIALDKFSDNKDIDSAILIVEKFILGNYILRGGRKNIVKDSLRYILSDYKRALKINEVLLKENEGLKEYIAIAPNLDEMTATKYRNIQQDAYIQGRAEEQQKAEQVIHENYIPKQKIKDKIEEINKMIAYEHNNAVIIQLGKQKRVLQKLLESEE